MSVSQSTEGRVPVTILHLKGDLDQKSHDEFERCAKEAFIANGARYAILDLREVRYLSSAGLKAIHSLFNYLREGSTTEVDELAHKRMRTGEYKSRHLKLANPSTNVKQVLTIAGYDLFMEIHPDVESAITSF